MKPGCHSDGGFRFSKCPNYSNSRRSLKLNVRKLTAKQIAVSPDGKMIYSGGHWDNSVRGFNIFEKRTTFHCLWHSDVITCLAIDALGTRLISGSRDRSCCIWSIEQDCTLGAKPSLTLFGHSSEISDVRLKKKRTYAIFI